MYIPCIQKHILKWISVEKEKMWNNENNRSNELNVEIEKGVYIIKQPIKKTAKKNFAQGAH